LSFASQPDFAPSSACAIVDLAAYHRAMRGRASGESGSAAQGDGTPAAQGDETPRAKSRGSVSKQRVPNMTSTKGARRPAVAHAPKQVRIIGGDWKRTPLAVADVAGLRPTPDRVRETLFNWIVHLRPDIAALRGLDLFAGSGALGFELASRGAQHVTLVESDPRALQALRAAKARLAAAQIDIVPGDAMALAAQWPAASFDLIFVDPPFDAGLHSAALAAAARLLAPGGLVYVESARPLTPGQAAQAGFAIARSGRAGRVAFHLLQPLTA